MTPFGLSPQKLRGTYHALNIRSLFVTSVLFRCIPARRPISTIFSRKAEVGAVIRAIWLELTLAVTCRRVPGRPKSGGVRQNTSGRTIDRNTDEDLGHYPLTETENCDKMPS